MPARAPCGTGLVINALIGDPIPTIATFTLNAIDIPICFFRSRVLNFVDVTQGYCYVASNGR